jgi:hypothetical protein
VFEPHISRLLAEQGCYVSDGQEALLAEPEAHIQFRIRRGKYDKGMVKALIIQALHVYGYASITFVADVADRQQTKQSNDFDFFSAKVKM